MTAAPRGLQRSHARAPRGAFTLLELLLAVAIAGMVVTALAGGLAGSMRGDPVTDLVDRLQDADRRIRIDAREEGLPAQVQCRSDGWYVLEAGEERRPVVLWEEELRVRCAEVDGTRCDGFVIDAHGRGPDLQVVIASRGEHARTSTYRVAGLSGQWLAEAR